MSFTEGKDGNLKSEKPCREKGKSEKMRKKHPYQLNSLLRGEHPPNNKIY